MSPSVVIACAMAEEMAPFLEVLPTQQVSERQWITTSGEVEITLAITGIGLVNAARAATLLSGDLYILAGTCGGLGETVRVGEVVAGTTATYLHADATAFGYQLGQIPGMPAAYISPLEARHLPADHAGLVLSGNSFVTADNVKQTRLDFPGVLAVDMETTAAAQIRHLEGGDWVSLRAVSDLCGPRAGEDFSIGLDQAAARSRDAVLALLEDF